MNLKLLTFVFLPALAFGYRWPFESGNGAAGPHRVTGTFGEYREGGRDGRGRLHAGVDLLPSNAGRVVDAVGTTVYAVEGAPANEVRIIEPEDQDFEHIIVGRFVYMHVETSRDLTPAGWPVTAGQAIARIKSLQQLSPHLHLAEFESADSSIQLNPLRAGGLDNLENHDTVSSVVFSPRVYCDLDGRRDWKIGCGKRFT